MLITAQAIIVPARAKPSLEVLLRGCPSRSTDFPFVFSFLRGPGFNLPTFTAKASIVDPPVLSIDESIHRNNVPKVP
jgi:hypothetical protein